MVQLGRTSKFYLDSPLHLTHEGPATCGRGEAGQSTALVILMNYGGRCDATLGEGTHAVAVGVTVEGDLDNRELPRQTHQGITTGTSKSSKQFIETSYTPKSCITCLQNWCFNPKKVTAPNTKLLLLVKFFIQAATIDDKLKEISPRSFAVRWVSFRTGH